MSTAASFTADTGSGLLDRVLTPGGLYAVYQPVIRLDDYQVVAHEGLVRACGLSLSPLQMLDLARRHQRLGEVEIAAARTVIGQYDYVRPDQHLLVNLSAHAILQDEVRPQEVIATLSAAGQDMGRFVIELTERDIVEDVARLAEAIGFLRASGVRLALDDFGNGHSNFELWHELSPEFVKLDRYLIDGISRSPGRLTIVKALVQVASELGTELIAEGLEHEADLEVVRDMGVRYAQGFLLGRPQQTPIRELPAGMRLAASWLPVRPSHGRRIGSTRLTAGHLLIEAPALSVSMTNFDVENLFRSLPDLHALPVVDADGIPVGLINRRVFNEKMSQPFARELNRRKSCTQYMHATPIMCDIHQSVDSMIDILCGEDQRYLSDGFIITADRRYRGLGTGESLVRRVTEHRVEAARYANPLTMLPGNIPITEHINRLLAAGKPFWAAYCDLNHFKPFNDQYGYFRGDRMIQLVADTLARHVQPSWDFLGHVGGDDFVVLFQSADWGSRCERMVMEFNAAARQLFDKADIERGMLECEDRNGHPAMFPLSTLSIGIAPITAAHYHEAEAVASHAAAAKRRAKRNGVGVYLLDARDGGADEAPAVAASPEEAGAKLSA
jgi:diguanylate cyclase (GGDEF)-like protein